MFRRESSTDELTASNVSGNAGREKLEEYNVRLISCKYREIKIKIIFLS